MNYLHAYLQETQEILQALSNQQAEMLENMVGRLYSLRERRGRLFIIGVGGGGAGNGSHAQSDFEKIAGIDATCLTDNASSITAYANDNGWVSVFVEQLRRKNLSRNDALLIFSVGGGTEETSKNIVEAINYAKRKDAEIFGIVGREGGYTKQAADLAIVIPPHHKDRITPHTEEVQAVLWHLMVNHPLFHRQRP